MFTDVVRRDVQQEKQVQTEEDTNSPSSVEHLTQKLIPDSKPMLVQTEGGVVNNIPSPDVGQIHKNINDKPDLVTLNKNPDAINDKGNIISKIDTVKSMFSICIILSK